MPTREELTQKIQEEKRRRGLSWKAIAEAAGPGSGPAAGDPAAGLSRQTRLLRIRWSVVSWATVTLLSVRWSVAESAIVAPLA